MGTQTSDISSEWNKSLIIPLVNFELENGISLEIGGTKIISSSPLEPDYSFLLNRYSHPYCKYALKMPCVNGKTPRATLKQALTVFKLFKDNLDYSVTSCLIMQDKEKIDYLPHYTGSWTIGYNPPKSLPYYLKKGEKARFCEFWKEFFGIGPENFAISRFQQANYRPYFNDRFVDYVESLEFLFVPDSEKGEIAYKFRTRGTLILGNDESSKKKEKIFTDLKNAYDLRSAIVHGNRKTRNKYIKNTDWKDLDDLIRPVRCYARQAIKYFFREKCLNDANKRKKLIERKTIFDSKGRIL